MVLLFFFFYPVCNFGLGTARSERVNTLTLIFFLGVRVNVCSTSTPFSYLVLIAEEHYMDIF